MLPDLVSPKERTYLMLALVVSGFNYLMLLISLVGIFYVLVGAAALAVAQGIAIGHLRGNAIRVSERQFPDVLRIARQVCAQLAILEVPPIYIMQSGGVLNAFATRFFGRNYVCIYSEILEMAYEHGEDEVAFVLAHELTHVARKHVWWKTVITPAAFVPFLGAAYSRACEYTCDAYAAYLWPQGAEGGILVLAAGKRLYREMDVDAYLAQTHEQDGFWMWLAEHVATHPNLPKRLASVRYFSALRNAAARPRRRSRCARRSCEPRNSAYVASDRFRDRLFDRCDARFVATVERPLLDPFRAHEAGVHEDLHVLAHRRLADAEIRHFANFLLPCQS